MIKVAVTGGIGSGKSVVCEVFEKLGIPVFYADQIAKELMNSDYTIKENLIFNFGSEIFDEEGMLLRKKIAEIIFNNKTLLSKVNEIVHPFVSIEFEKWAKNQNTPYVIEESAIIFESGLASLFDKIITVIAPLEMRVERVMKRDNVTREKVLERLKNQSSDDEKIAKSDFIIVNDDKEMMIPQIINIHSKLL